MSRFFFILFILFVTGCAVSNNPQRKFVKKLQRGAIREDTSYAYALPFQAGTSYLLTQAYFGSFTHKERIALDFSMKKGTKICAARDGVVVRLKEDSNKGGWNKKFQPLGNNVVIQHADGTRSGYWHLQQNGVLVNIGDTVKQGQVIALSGQTGYAAMPHLHFIVWKSANNNWVQIPTRFKTTRGVRYLRPWRRYYNL